MERYIGGDVHGESTTFVVLNHRGKRLRRDVVATNGRALVDYIKEIPRKRHLCIDEGEWSQWLAELLWRHVDEFVVYQPHWRPGPKSDAIDAGELAERLRTDRIGTPVFKDPKRFTALRTYTRIYGMLTLDVARTKNRLKSLFRARGISCQGKAIYEPGHRAEMARRLPPATRSAVRMLGQELDDLEALKAEAELAMQRESRKHRITRILETAPGLGPVRVSQLLSIVVTPHRFRTTRQFWAYCGFGVVTRTSADWVQEKGRWVRVKVNRTRGLNFNHNHVLKSIFKGAAASVLSQTAPDPLRNDYKRLLEHGTKPTLAMLTIARKIAALVLAMWKNQEVYQPEKYRMMSG
jgi:transposase